LRQVLINLLANAVKFTSKGGICVRIKTEREPGTIDFEIEDTGAGIDADELENLFEAFVQTKIGQQSQQGTGLGLTIARSFVQLMGGEMSVNSAAGRGTIFKFDIKINPVATANCTPQQPTSRVIAIAPNQPKYRILIADDAWDSRQFLVKLLSPFGFEIYEACNGIEVIESWEKNSPHLIFMDLRMPKMDGYEASKGIKTTTKGQSTAIVAVTASSFDAEKAVIISAGCDDFIRKPFREENIFDAMQKLIGVQFIWEPLTPAPVVSETDVNVLTKAAFASLPAELVANSYQAISNLDIEVMQKKISQIGELNQPLAEAIATCMKNFQYEQLLDLMQPLRDEP